MEVVEKAHQIFLEHKVMRLNYFLVFLCTEKSIREAGKSTSDFFAKQLT